MCSLGVPARAGTPSGLGALHYGVVDWLVWLLDGRGGHGLLDAGLSGEAGLTLGSSDVTPVVIVLTTTCRPTWLIFEVQPGRPSCPDRSLASPR